MAVVTTAELLAERRDLDYSDRIAELEPDASPLTVLLKKIGKATVQTAEFSWFEDERNARTTTYTGTTESSAGDNTTLKVADASIFRKWDVVDVPLTGEIMLVTAVNPGSGTIEVYRGYGTTPAAVLENGETLLIIANAHEENARAGAMKMGQPVKKSNYVQIFRNPVTISKTADAEKQRANPQERLRLQKKVGVEHMIDIEYAFWFGEPKEDLVNITDGPRRMTGGVLYFATENVLDVQTENGGVLTYALMEQWLEDVFRYGSQEKWLFAAPRLISVIDQIAEGRLQTRPKEETYGVRVREWVSAHGVLNIVKHPLFRGPEYGNMGVVIDLQVEELDYVHLPGRDTKLRLNVGEPDRDGFLDEYITECGLRFKQPKRHGKITGVQSAA